MTADIRWFWSHLNANYWFYPALFSLLAAVLAFSMIYLDRNGFAEWLNAVQLIVPARPQSANNMLTVIAGSTIGVASTVFSITIAAVAYASGNYGPRLLTNFMGDRGNQLSLATFIGTFVYALIVLRSVREEHESPADATDAMATSLPGFVPQLSLLVAFALMGLSVGVLVYFLNHIPASIRINTVLNGIAQRLLDDIRDEFPNQGYAPPEVPAPGGLPIAATSTGYVRMIDFADLEHAAEEAGCRLALLVRTGDFVHRGSPLARVCSGEEGEELAASVRACFSIGASRTPEQDPQFLIDELVEIALRALSPGINDPFTAITALHWLGAATAELGQRDLRKRIAGKEPGTSRVVPLPDDFAHYLARGLGAARGAVSTSPMASLVMLDVLASAAAQLQDEARIAQLRREGTQLMEQARLSLAGPDLHQVEARLAIFQQGFAR